MNRRSARNRHRRPRARVSFDTETYAAIYHTPDHIERRVTYGERAAIVDHMHDGQRAAFAGIDRGVAPSLLGGMVHPRPPPGELIAIIEREARALAADRSLVRIRYEDGAEDVAELHTDHPMVAGTVRIK